LFNTIMSDRTESKRNLIMDAAIRIFAQRGYYKSRIHDIAKEADVAYGLFYHYFPSKEDILINIYQNAWNNLLGYIDHINRKTDEPFDRLRSVIRYIFRSFHRNPQLLKVLIMDVPRVDKFYNDENQHIFNLFFTRIAEIIEAGQKRGLIRKSHAPLIAAFIIHGSVDSIIRQYVYDPDFNLIEFSAMEITDQIAGVVFQGLRSDSKH